MTTHLQISAKELLGSLLKNIIQNQFTDLGSSQSLLLNIIFDGLRDPETLSSEFIFWVNNAAKSWPSTDPEAKLSNKSQLFFLTFENILFNLYSKLKTSETVKIQDSLYHTQASISFSILDLESSHQDINHAKFSIFVENLLNSSALFEDLLKLIPKNTKPDLAQLVCLQVKNLFSTFDYIRDRENLFSDNYTEKRRKFIQYIGIAPPKAPIKESIKTLNKTIFMGDTNQIIKLISSQENRQAFEISLLRVYHYYRRNVTNPKYFESRAINGQDSVNKIIQSYIKSKATNNKDTLFRLENMNTEPLLSFILAYMTFYFLPIQRSFENFIQENVSQYAKLDATNFYSMFVDRGLTQAVEFIESLPLEFKDFIRRIYAMINEAGFKDKSPSAGPIKTLVINLFFTNPQIHEYNSKIIVNNNASASSLKKSDSNRDLQVPNYFKDLFFEASLKKHSYIPEFQTCYDKLNGLFDAILEKKRAFKSEIQIPNYLKFYITKPLLRYDYTIIKKALENPYEDSDDDFGDVEQPKPVTTGLTMPPKTSTPNKGIKRILEDDDDDFEEEFEAGDQIYYREEPQAKVEPPKKIEQQQQSQWEPQTQTRGGPGPDIISITSSKPAQNKPSVMREEEEDGLISDEEEEEYMRGNSRNQVSQEKQKPKPYIAQPEITKTVSVYPATIENPPREEYDYRETSNYERERGRDRELLDKFERETESKIQMLQKEHYNEKRILQNRLEVLEEKYAIYVDMVSHPNQENVRSENNEKTQSYRSKEENQNVEEEPRRERRRVKKEDDEFYKLHQQILQEREKVLQAEVDYKMHNRINLLGHGYKK